MRRPATLALLVLAACGGVERCPYASRCEGDVLQLCEGSPPVYSTDDCGGTAAVCARQPGGPASCVPTCDASYPTHCEGDLLVGCDFSSGRGLVTAIDCYGLYDFCDPFQGCLYGGVCVDLGGGDAQCEPY